MWTNVSDIAPKHHEEDMTYCRNTVANDIMIMMRMPLDKRVETNKSFHKCLPVVLIYPGCLAFSQDLGYV